MCDTGAVDSATLAGWLRALTNLDTQVTDTERIDQLRALVPDDSGLDAAEPFLTPLITLSAFDLGQDRLCSFSAYRFLYERRIGPEVRPWLPSAFCAAAALPHLHPEKRRKLLQSISEAAATAPGWSSRSPAFYPEWVEKIEAGTDAD